MITLDDHITGNYYSEAPFNRPDWYCHECFWRGNKPNERAPYDNELELGKYSYLHEEDVVTVCPECDKILEE